MRELVLSYGYEIFATLGIISAFIFLLLSVGAKKAFDNVRRLVFITSTVAIGAIVGGKLLFGISLMPEYFSNGDYLTPFKEMLSGGIVFYGGLIGGVLSGALACKLEELDFWSAADFVAPAIPLFHVFGRVGCFFAGCCYGKPWENGIICIGYDNVKRIPVQLIESGLNVLIFALLLVYIKVRRKKGTELYSGGKRGVSSMEIYLFSYAAMRFLLEFLRGDAERGFFGALSTSQWISVIVVAFLIVLRIRERTKSINKE